MAPTQNLILENCNNPGDIIIVEYGKALKSITLEDEQAVSEGPKFESMVYPVFNSASDQFLGCYTSIGTTSEPAGTYYLGKNYKTCSECGFSMKKEILAENKDITNEFNNAKSYINSLIGGK